MKKTFLLFIISLSIAISLLSSDISTLAPLSYKYSQNKKISTYIVTEDGIYAVLMRTDKKSGSKMTDYSCDNYFYSEFIIGTLSENESFKTDNLLSCIGITFKGKAIGTDEDIYGLIHLTPDNASKDIKKITVFLKNICRVTYLGITPSFELVSKNETPSIIARLFDNPYAGRDSLFNNIVIKIIKEAFEPISFVDLKTCEIRGALKINELRSGIKGINIKCLVQSPLDASVTDPRNPISVLKTQKFIDREIPWNEFEQTTFLGRSIINLCNFSA